jgi:hypothetical protein
MDVTLDGAPCPSDQPKPVDATASRLRAVTADLPVPVAPRDGDCRAWAAATAERLLAEGFAAQVVNVAGWVDEQARILAFLHTAVVVPVGTIADLSPPDRSGPSRLAAHDGSDDPDDFVIDVTARQFNPALPSCWSTTWSIYQRRLASATYVRKVTRWHVPAASVIPQGSTR